MELLGKSLVVIGGTSGIGLSAARAFVEAGAQVVVVGRKRRDGEQAARMLGSGAVAICADECDPATAVRAIAQAVNSFGRFDGLYHVEGGIRMGDGPLDQLSDEGWRCALDWNLTSAMYSNRAAIRHFLAQEQGGCILNLGAAMNGVGVLHGYASAKSALVGFSQGLAAYYASRGIRVNVLVPAGHAQDSPDGQEHALHAEPDLVPDACLADLDAAAIFFMSEGARLATGQVLRVDFRSPVSPGTAPSAPVSSAQA